MTVGVQAFSVGRHLGVQFHPETAPDSAPAWAQGDPRLLEATNAAHRLFDRFAGRAGLFFDHPTLVRA